MWYKAFLFKGKLHLRSWNMATLIKKIQRGKKQKQQADRYATYIPIRTMSELMCNVANNSSLCKKTTCEQL